MIVSGWEKLSLKKGYELMRSHGFSKPMAILKSIKGVKVYRISFLRGRKTN